MKGRKARIICNVYTPIGVVVVDVVVTVFAVKEVGVARNEYVTLLYIMVFKFKTF
jgi:hypothetical protein